MGFGKLALALQNGNEAANQAPGSAPADPFTSWTPSGWASSRGLGDIERRINFGKATPQDIAYMGQVSSVDPSAGAQAMWNDFVARVQDHEAPHQNALQEALSYTPAGLMAPTINAIPAITPAQIATQAVGGTNMDLATVAAGGGALAAGPSAAPSPGPTTQTLQGILDSTPPPPSIGQGVNVAGPTDAAAGLGAPPSVSNSVLSDFAANASVDAINAATPGTISMGVPTSDPLFPTVAGAAGAMGGVPTVPPQPSPMPGPLQTALTTGAGAAAVQQAAGGAHDPNADPNTNANTDIRDPNAANTRDPLTGQSADVLNTNQIVNGAAKGAGSGLGNMTLERLLSGDVGLGDLSSAVTLGDLGRVLGTAGSIYGANEQANKLKELSDRYMALGEPSRQRYEASFDPNFDVSKIPGLEGAMDTSYQALLRGLSTHGNPFGAPSGLADALKYVSGNVALPALQNYRNQLAATGGYGAFSTAAPGAATGAINAGGNVYADLGRGISTITNPPGTLEQALRSLRSFA